MDSEWRYGKSPYRVIGTRRSIAEICRSICDYSFTVIGTSRSSAKMGVIGTCDFNYEAHSMQQDWGLES